MHSLGLAVHLHEKELRDELTIKNANLASLAHTLMTDMGNKFKILIQQKGMKDPVLSGLRLSQRIR